MIELRVTLIGLSLLFVAVAASAQTERPSNDVDFPATETVSVLRTLNRPSDYVSDFLAYMGLAPPNDSSQVRSDAQATLEEVLEAPDSQTIGAMRANVVMLMSGGSPELRAAVLYAYYNRYVELAREQISADAFEADLPLWTELSDFLPKFIAHYAFIDQAWQCRAEGNDALALGYYERVRSTALMLFAEYPDDPNQIWVVYNYMFAASALGPDAVYEAVTHLKGLVSSNAPSMLTWSARYQIGLFSSLYPNIDDEHRMQYEAMAKIIETPFFQSALNNPALTRDARGMIELMEGHALFGTHQYSAAEEQYKYVLDEFADRLEWAPRASGRSIVDLHNYGICNSAAYSLAACTRILHSLEPSRGAVIYERFLQTYPNSEYADVAAIDLAGICIKLGDFTRAEALLTGVIANAIDSSVRQRAQDRLATLAERSR